MSHSIEPSTCKGPLPDEVLEKYIRAGKIAARVREEAKRIVREGMKLLEICETIENMIRDLGGSPAFPCNISVNEVAAHYTSPPNDARVIPEGALVKVDVGVHIDGYIADTAATICFSPEYEDMIHAAERALEAALRIMRPGLMISRVSSEIQSVIERYGFKPISNLSGHEIGRYMIHAGKSIPNVSHLSIERIRSGGVYAIEPFITFKDAAGRVEDGPEKYIFRLVKTKTALKSANAKSLLRFIEENFRTLPFAERWLKKRYASESYKTALSELLSSKCLMAYPVFIEVSRRPVAQAEHTVYVGERDIIILT
ncbi:MAG: type II methionyl aminopeptidase [Candidatus Bathyarchaeia archaeon]|nr:type II methionyl aminopeptidase [Candidatus Bathyarchaeota archaeon]